MTNHLAYLISHKYSPYNFPPLLLLTRLPLSPRHQYPPSSPVRVSSTCQDQYERVSREEKERERGTFHPSYLSHPSSPSIHLSFYLSIYIAIYLSLYINIIVFPANENFREKVVELGQPYLTTVP